MNCFNSLRDDNAFAFMGGEGMGAKLTATSCSMFIYLFIVGINFNANYICVNVPQDYTVFLRPRLWRGGAKKLNQTKSNQVCMNGA